MNTFKKVNKNTMNTLITSGCSYTQYSYPCWNMWLGQHYDKHIPLGKAGTGPKYSYIRIRDYFKYQNETDPKDHHVIVQWSSLMRHDYRINYFSWSGGGSITNNPLFSDDYQEKHFNLIDSTCDLLYYIESLISLSKELGFKLHMLYMFEPWIEEFFGEPTAFDIQKINKGYDDWISSEYLKSLKKHYESDYFIPCSIESFCLDNPKTEFPVNDSHPSPLQHFKYYIYLSLQLKLRPPLEEWKVMAEQLNSIVYNPKTYTIFIDIFHKLVVCNTSLWYWKTNENLRTEHQQHDIDLIKKCLIEYNKKVNVT